MIVKKLNERTLAFYFDEIIDEQLNEKIVWMKKQLELTSIEGIQSVQNTYHMMAVHFNPHLVDTSKIEAVVLKGLLGSPDSIYPSRTVEVPVCYDGPDLEKIAAAGKLSISEVIQKHSEALYHVYFLGFSAGFPYLGGLNSDLITPRLEQPRLRVESGSVGIADRQTGIYTVPSPGGWNLIGRTPFELFSPTQQPNCLIQAGDKLKFVPISTEQYDQYKFCSKGEKTIHSDEKKQMQLKGIKILKAGILSTIQDEGRYDGLSYGLSQSGVADPFAYELALALVGQNKPYPVLEVTMGGFECQFEGETTFAITGAESDVYLNDVKLKRWTTYKANSGDRLKINSPSHGFRNYLAFGCKFHEQYRFMNAYATDLKSKLGGMNGRKLMEGDCIYFTEKTEDNKSFMDNNQWRKGSISQSSLEKSHYFENLMRTTKSVRLHRGPQYSRLSQLEWQAFLETTYIVSPKSDRMGIRLEGSTFRPSEKMDILTDVIAFGAIQLTQDGTPIILMSERQTTGGYAKIANVAYDDLSILAQAKPGDHIEFIEFTNVTENTNKSIYINNRNDLKDLIIWEDMQDLSETIKIALKYENSSAVYQVLVERRAD